MGSSAKGVIKKARGFGTRSLTMGIDPKLNKAINRGIEKPFRKGATAAKKQAARDTQKQMQLEKVRTAEAESEIALRRAQAKGKKGGRQSLIKSAAGLATNLGGTA